MQEWILLVDDDLDDCDFLKENLIQVGFKLSVEFAHDGPAAFKLLESSLENLPKLIVLDVNMPIMNGMIILGKLNLVYKIPVILYTTSCHDELIKEAKSLGAIDCVKKGTSFVDNIKFAKRVFDLVGSFSYTELKAQNTSGR